MGKRFGDKGVINKSKGDKKEYTPDPEAKKRVEARKAEEQENKRLKAQLYDKMIENIQKAKTAISHARIEVQTDAETKIAKVDIEKDGDVEVQKAFVAYGLRAIKQAVNLKIEEGQEEIDGIKIGLDNLRESLENIPISDIKKEVLNNINQAAESIEATKQLIGGLVETFNNITIENRGDLQKCLDFVMTEIKQAKEAALSVEGLVYPVSSFGQKLFDKITNDNVAESYDKAEKLHEEIQKNIKRLEDTVDKTDDDLINMYDILDSWVCVVMEEINKRTVNDIKSKELNVTNFFDVEKICDNCEQAKITIDKILSQYLTINKYQKEVVINSQIYDGINVKGLNTLFLQYAGALNAFYQEDIKDLEESGNMMLETAVTGKKAIEESIKNGEKIEENDEVKEKLYKAENNESLNIVKEKILKIEKKYKELESIYNKIDLMHKECTQKVNDEISADVQKIKISYERVIPTVPDYSAEVYVYNPNTLIANMFNEITAQALNNSGVATIRLSTVFAPFVGKTVNELTKQGLINEKWCSIKVLQDHNLISRDAQALFIVDDGYEDFGVDKAVFNVIAMWSRAFSPEDNGKIFFSASAMKKFKNIINKRGVNNG